MSCHSRTLRCQLPCVCYRRGANAEPIWACVIFTRARGATRGIRRWFFRSFLNDGEYFFFPRPKSAVHVYVEFYAPYKQTWRAAMAFVASIHNNGWRWLKWSDITSTADEAALTDIVQFSLACVGRRRVFRCERNSSIAESRRPARPKNTSNKYLVTLMDVTSGISFFCLTYLSCIIMSRHVD
jgi:hypothetical protein